MQGNTAYKRLECSLNHREVCVKSALDGAAASSKHRLSKVFSGFQNDFMKANLCAQSFAMNILQLSR